MVRLLGGLQRYDRPGWYGVGGAEPCRTNGDPALWFRGLAWEFFTELSRSIFQLGARLDEGGWLPVSLTKVGHWYGFIVSPDDGAVSHRR